MIYNDAVNDIIENVSKITQTVNQDEINQMIDIIMDVENVLDVQD